MNSSARLFEGDSTMANVRDISFASFNLYNLQVPNKPTHTGTATFTEET